MRLVRLGVNIDHVATLRNARGGEHPSPIRAAQIAEQAGADGITIHLREDRRHIRDNDVIEVLKATRLPVNLEMGATNEMVEIACAVKPNAVCIVPENRQEITTEGGLAVVQEMTRLSVIIDKLKAHNIRVSLFIDPRKTEIEAAALLNADIVELHTGRYCDCNDVQTDAELNTLIMAAKLADQLGLEVHAGHGLTTHNVSPIASITQIKELNIGHFLIGEAVFKGLGSVISEMRDIIHLAANKN